MQREQLEFGRGSFVGIVMRDPEAFLEADSRDQARMLGWVAGCPVVEELTDPLNTQPGRGPEEMLKRYGQVSFWFGYAMEAVQTENPDLYDKMMSDVSRQVDEPIGRHEPESIPQAYETAMQPMTTLVGYITPRLLIEQIGLRANITRDEKSSRLAFANTALKQAAAAASSPEEFLAGFADTIRTNGSVAEETIKKQFDASGWIEEHNGRSMVANLEEATRKVAPELHELAYS